MWLTRKLKEKQEARNTACDCLLLQIRQVLIETDVYDVLITGEDE